MFSHMPVRGVTYYDQEEIKKLYNIGYSAKDLTLVFPITEYKIRVVAESNWVRTTGKQREYNKQRFFENLSFKDVFKMRQLHRRKVPFEEICAMFPLLIKPCIKDIIENKRYKGY